MLKSLSRYEPVEWLYDGLSGQVIQWTKANGNTHDDPSVLAFVVGVSGEVQATLFTGGQYQPGSFAGWLSEQADAYERAHPRTRIPLVRPKVAMRGEGEEAMAACAEVDDARAATRPLLLYFGRDRHAEDDKQGKKEAKAARSFEKGPLDSKSAAKEAQGWALLRFDLADELHAAYARTLGVTEAPTLLLWPADAAEPQSHDKSLTAGGLALLLKKHAPARSD